MRTAVLGCGSIGRRHLRNLKTLGISSLLAYDPSASAREAVVSELTIPAYGDLDDIWRQMPDVVFITSPTSLHMPLALAAAENACHLFIEKPLSHTTQDVNRLLKLVRQRGLITMVGCNMRFHPGPAQVKQLIDENAVGDVISARIHTGSYLPNWRPHMDYRHSYSASAEQGGGALLDCIHEIDLALWYFGAADVLSAAVLPAHSIGLDVDGLAEILLHHHSGALSSVQLNFVQRDYRRTCQIIGSEGSIYWDFEAGTVKCFRDGEWQSYEQPQSWTVNDMYIDETKYFLSCIETHTPTFCDVREGLAALNVVLDTRAFAEQQREVAHG